MLGNVGNYKKLLAALASTLAVIVSSGLLTGDALRYTTIASAAVGALLVWYLENVPAPEATTPAADYTDAAHRAPEPTTEPR